MEFYVRLANTYPRLVNLAVGPPGVRFKQSSMPFVQMENISHFLRACQSPPVNLQPHDIFQTVALYESKDPAQVLVCLGAFSRRAHVIQPNKFPNAIGGKNKSGLMSPQSTGGYSASNTKYPRARGTSNVSETSSTTSYPASQALGGRDSPSTFSDSKASTSTNSGLPRSPPSGVSSWSKRTDEGATTPAWNIHQYGYMGGASQGNQGITFGGRRQITTPGPKVPSLAEKERKRREAEAEAEGLRLQAEEAEHKRRVEREAEEERDRIAEEQRWAEETSRQRELDRKKAEEEKRNWEAEEMKWRDEEEARVREEKEAEARLEKERQRKRATSDARLRGQFLNQYQAEQRQLPTRPDDEDLERRAERERVKELERELEKAKEREQQYERERQERLQLDRERHALESHDMNVRRKDEAVRDRSRSRIKALPSAPSHSHRNSEDSWRTSERDYLRQEWSNHHESFAQPSENPASPQPPRPLPIPKTAEPVKPESRPSEPTPALPSRPLPNPATYTAPSPSPLSFQRPTSTSPSKSPFQRPPSSPTKISTPLSTKPISPFSKPPSSLLSREMELERLRQQEWEEKQKETKSAAERGVRNGGSGPGESWDVNQYGYVGGDSQNRGGVGLGVSGPRRQIIGPREMGGK